MCSSYLLENNLDQLTKVHKQVRGCVSVYVCVCVCGGGGGWGGGGGVGGGGRED